MMNPRYLEDARELEKHRKQYMIQAQNVQRQPTTGFTLGHSNSGSDSSSSQENAQSRVYHQPVADPFIQAIPNLYAPSGFDILSILIAVRSRPNPTFEIGALDSSVALTLCDAAHPDLPIVYCTESFSLLTGYHMHEIIGSNCRFLQSPPSCFPRPVNEIINLNAASKKELRTKIARGEEVQVQLLNFAKDGTMFRNMLTVVPIQLVDGEGRMGSYVVGLQADAASVFR